jgi:hypothetical protein
MTSPSSSPLDRVAVARDTPNRATDNRRVALFGPRVGVLKGGREALVRWGPPGVAAAREHGRAGFRGW